MRYTLLGHIQCHLSYCPPRRERRRGVAKEKITGIGRKRQFSDSLTIPKALALYRHFADRVMTGFGIGTQLTNDTGIAPLNIVMKLVRCNGQAVAKLADTPGKSQCTDETFLAYLRQVFGHPG
jgi:nicotinate phosphoribosyltransferase